MKITDALLGEHGVLYTFFDILAVKLDHPDQAARLALAETLDQLLRSHAQAEEEILFPALDPHLGDMGPLAVMRQEHQRIDALLDELRTAGPETDMGAVFGELLALVNGHFQKEEAVLFHMAEEFLDEATLTDLGARWAERRRVTLAAAGCAA